MSTPAWHFEKFAEFTVNELAVGGPDPHMRYVGELSKALSPEEIAWYCGVYLSVYNAPAAEVVWHNWPRQAVLENPTSLLGWLQDNWKGVPLRRERRDVRTPTRLAACLTGYAHWQEDVLPNALRGLPEDPVAGYDLLWTLAGQLHSFGRYACFKLLEALARYAYPELPRLHDIRARGGWSPRLTLALLEPTMKHHARRDTAPAIAEAEAVATQLRYDLCEHLGLDIDWYTFEVMLCDYRQSYEGKRQYPGRSIDSELAYLATVKEHFKYYGSEIPAIRTRLHPSWSLGEVWGWDGPRNELGTVLADHDYTWSDIRYVYGAHIAKPMLRITQEEADVRIRSAARETLGQG